MADDSQLSSVIDEDGKLFGIVNVVDALIILLAVAVVVAGVALVVPGGAVETRYATIDMGPQPEYIAGQIATGDEASGIRVTDVYTYPAQGDNAGQTYVLVRAAVNGTAIDPEASEAGPIAFNGEPLRFGRTVTIETNKYTAEGNVIDVEPTGESIEIVTEELVVQTTVDATTATLVQPGDTYAVGGTELLTVESVTAYDVGDPTKQRLVMGVTARARIEDNIARFGDRPLQPGSVLPIRTEKYTLSASVVNAGSLEQPGTPATRSVTIEVPEISRRDAARLEVGMAESLRGTQTAVLADIDTRPREVVVQSGASFRTIQHPRDRSATLTLRLSVYEQTDGALRFRGEPLQVGQQLTVTLDGIPVTGEVTRVS